MPTVTDTEASPTEHGEDLWKAFADKLWVVKDNVRVRGKKMNKINVSAALKVLVSRESLTEVPSAQVSPDFIETLEQRRELILEKFNITKQEYEYCTKVLTYMGDSCAKNQTPAPLVIAWDKMKRWGIVPRENCVSTYLYAFGLDDEWSPQAGEVANFHDLLFEPNEKTVALRVKSLIHAGDAVGAETMLNGLVSVSFGSLLLLLLFRSTFFFSSRMIAISRKQRPDLVLRDLFFFLVGHYRATNGPN